MKITRTTPLDQLPAFLAPDEVAALLHIGRSLCYEMLRRNELPAVRCGRLLRVSREALVTLAAGRREVER